MTEQPSQVETSSLNPRDETRRKLAIRINLVTGVLLLVVSFPSLLTLHPEASLQYIGNIITAVMALISFVSAWISHRYSSTRGSIIFITAILLISLGVPIYANGLGLQSAIIVAVIVASIAATTLPASLAAEASIAALVVETLVILLDLYLPDLGLGTYESQYINPFLFLILIVFGYFASRQFNSYTLRNKLIVAFVAVAVVAVGTLALVTGRANRIRLTLDVGESLTAQAESRALIVGETLAKELQGLQSFGLSKVVQDRVESASAGYIGDPANIQAEIEVLDKRWRAADAANNNNDPLVQGVLNEVISSELREYRDTFPENVEVFVTDQYGANVGATNRTSDYYQADEGWWQGAYNNGEGALYIGQPAFDESSATYASIMAVPLYAHDTKKVIGVLRTTVKLTAITDVLTTAHIGKTGQIELYVAEGQEIPAEGGGLVPGDPNALALPADVANYAEINYDNRPSLVSRVPVTSLDPKVSPVISQLGWSLVIHQDRQESLAPVEDQTRTITVISILLIGLATLTAFFASQILARPVQSLTSVAEQIASGDLGARAVITTQDEIGALAASFNRMTDQLNQTLVGLEQRVAERTADVEIARQQTEKRAQELQTISEISRVISTEQRLDILLPLITRLVSERFDFYHAGIFLIDNARQFAVLQAANSEGGKRMLERGHKLEVGQTGIVGNVAQTGKPRIALDVGADAVYFDNPDLPNTRSEMALPLNSRGRTVGILDVQSLKAGAFTESDTNTLSILADQVAIAIDNARLFEQSQQALSEVQTLYRQYQAQEWQAFIKQEARIGYHQLLIGGKPIEKALESNEIREVMEKGEILVTNEAQSKIESSIVVPVKLRGQTIGVLNIKAPSKNRQWNQDEINLAQAVSDRLALALENARLLQESQRRAAKEQKIGDVTTKIGASINMRNVLQTAVEELGRALPGSEIVIQFQNDEK